MFTKKKMHRSAMVAAVAAASAAVAVSAGAGVAAADVSPLPDEARAITTVGGWHTEAALRELTVTQVPNLAQAFTSREGFVSALATATVHRGGTGALHGAEVELSLDTGCGTDVSNGVTVGLQSSLGAAATVNIGPMTSVSPGVNANIGPSVSAQLKPGAVTNIALGTKTVDPGSAPGPDDPFLAGVRVSELPVVVNNCLGPVSVRLVSKVTVSTTTSNEVVYAYSKPMWL